MEGSTGNSKNVPKKSTSLGRIMGFRQYTLRPEVIKVRVVTIDVSSIGIKFENFMQAGCRDLGSQPCTAESPLFCPNWYSFLEHF